MPVNIGNAVGYIDLNTTGLVKGGLEAEKELYKLEATVKKVDKPIEELGKTAKTTGTDIDKFGKEAKSSTAPTETLRAKVDKLKTSMSSLSKGMISAGRDMTMKVTLPIVALGTGIIATSAKFQSGMSKVSAISGAVGNELLDLSDKAKEMGIKTKFSATESAEAFSYMAMAGWKTTDMLEGIEGIMNLAAASGEDLASTSDIVTDALTAFGMTAKDTNRFVDVLAKTASNSNTNVSLMGETFKLVAPVAGALKYSVEDVSVALGLMANSGIKASRAGSSLRNIFTNLVKPVGEAKTAIKDLGISVVNADGSMKPLSQTMLELKDKFSKLTTAQKAQYAAMLAGKEGMSGLLAIVNSTDADFVKLTKSIDESSGAAKSMADVMLDNVGGQFTILKSALQGFALQLGDIILPYIKQFIGFLQELADKLNNMTQKQKEHAIVLAIVIAAIGPLLLIVGKLIAFIPMLITGIQTIGVALGALSGPIGWVILAIGAITAAIVYLYKTNEDFKNAMDLAWSKIKEAFVSAWNAIKPALSSLWDSLKNLMEALKPLLVIIGTAMVLAWSFLIGQIKGFISALAPLIAAVGNVVDFISNILKGLWALITGDFEGVKKYFGTALINFRDFFINIFSAIWNYVKGFFEGFAILPSSFLQMGKDIITGLINGISSGFNKVVNFVGNLGRSISNKFKSILGINSPSKVFDKYGQYIDEGLANGIEKNKGSVLDQVKAVADGIKQTMEKNMNSLNKIGSALTAALKARYEEEEKIQIRALDNEVKNIEDASNEKIALYDKEYGEKLKLIDKEAYDLLKGVQDQIDILDNTTAAEEKALKEQEYQNKISELNKQLLAAETAEEKLSIQEDLSSALSDHEREKLLESRDAQKESLKLTMDEIKKSSEEKKVQLAIDLDIAKSAAKDDLEAKALSMNEEKIAITAHFAELTTQESLEAEARKLFITKNNDEIISLLQTYNPLWQNEGQSFADSLINGLNSEKEPMQEAISSMLNMDVQVEGQKNALRSLMVEIDNLEKAQEDASAKTASSSAGSSNSVIDNLGSMSEAFADTATDIEGNLPSITESFGAIDDASVLMGTQAKNTARVQIKANEDTVKSSDESAQSIWESVVKWYSDTNAKIKQFSDDMKASLYKFFTELPGKIAEFTGKVLGNIITWASDMNDKAINLGKDFLDNIIRFFSTLPTKIGEFIGYTLTKIILWAIDMNVKAIQMGKDFIANVVDFFKTLPGKVYEFITGALNKVIQWNKDMTTWATTTAVDFVFNLIDTIKSLPKKIYDEVQKVIAKVIEWGTNMRTTSREEMGKVVTGIKDKFASLPEDMMQIGINIVQGLWNGIKNMKDWIFGKIGEFGSGIISGIKSALDINSPSKKTMELGEYTAQGFGEGFMSKMNSVSSHIQDSVVDALNFDSTKEIQIDFISDVEKMCNVVTDWFDILSSKIILAVSKIKDSMSDLTTTYGSIQVSSDGTLSVGYVGNNGKTLTKEKPKSSDVIGKDADGDTFIFNSQAKLTEAECARQVKKTKKDMAEGF